MKISHLGLGQTTPPARSQADDSVLTNGTEQNESASARGYTPSPELLQLVHQVRAEPEVRDNRVQEVAARLKSGHYLSAASAQATATALVQSLD